MRQLIVLCLLFTAPSLLQSQALLVRSDSVVMQRAIVLHPLSTRTTPNAIHDAHDPDTVRTWITPWQRSTANENQTYCSGWRAHCVWVGVVPNAVIGYAAGYHHGCGPGTDNGCPGYAVLLTTPVGALAGAIVGANWT